MGLGAVVYLMTYPAIIRWYTMFIQKESLLHYNQLHSLKVHRHRLKLVIGVDISRREDSNEGNEVCVCRSRRRDKAERRTRFRVLVAGDLGGGIEDIEVDKGVEMGYCWVGIEGEDVSAVVLRRLLARRDGTRKSSKIISGLKDFSEVN
jgi:hypothetical protein